MRFQCFCVLSNAFYKKLWKIDKSLSEKTWFRTNSMCCCKLLWQISMRFQCFCMFSSAFRKKSKKITKSVWKGSISNEFYGCFLGFCDRFLCVFNAFVCFRALSRKSPKRSLNLCLKRLDFDRILCVFVCFWIFFERISLDP